MAIKLPDWFGRKPKSEPADPDALRVLMVCMGNICRSPTAEGVLRAKLARAGLARRVIVDSAGTHGMHAGEAPDPRAVRHAAQRGYDLAVLRARPVVASDFMQFDWLIAMDRANLDWLERKAPPGSQARKTLLLTQASVSWTPMRFRTRTTGPRRVLRGSSI